MTEPCTVVVAPAGRTCGKPGITSFESGRGERFVECGEHAVGRASVEFAAEGPAAHPPTRTTRPFVLVRDAKIVGYAESRGPGVIARAAALGAEIVPVVR